MKRLLKIHLLIIGLLLTMSVIPSFAQSPNRAFKLTMFQQSNSEDHDVEGSSEGNRKPSRPVEIYLSESDGLTIPGYDVEEILSYEVFTIDGDPVAVFTEEEDFISFIFSATGAYEIRLQFEEITLTGVISL